MSKHAASLSDRIRRMLPVSARDDAADESAPFAVDETVDLTSAVPPRRRWTRASTRAAVLGFAGLLAIIGWWWWQGRPREVTAAPALVATGVALPGSAAPSSADVVVHVVGDVRHPGLVTLPNGSRVDDALAAAGGLRVGGRLGGVNLAREVVDGEQIVFGRHASQVAPTEGGLLDLNSATAGDFEALPGIGPVLAQRIVTWRESNGRFSTVEELREVSGIGESTYADLAPLVRV